MSVNFINKTILICVGLLLTHIKIDAQGIHLGIGGGLSLYSGEIETYHFSDGVYVKARPALDAYMRFHGDGPIAVQAGFWIGSLAADDRESSSEGRRNRALRFTTPLQTVRVMGELYPLRFFQKDIPIAEIYMTMGIEYFRFNPSTDFQNQTFELQPLGTEGQNIALNDGNEPYSLNEWAIPFGGGMRFWIMEDMYINLQALYHYTRTDYIDDVSTVYPDINLLNEIGAELSGQLSYRSDEITGDPLPIPGSQRGSPGVNDAFFTGSVSLVFILNSNSRGIGCPQF